MVVEAMIDLLIVDFVEFGFFSAISDIYKKFAFDHILTSILVFISCLRIGSLIKIVLSLICNISKTSKIFFGNYHDGRKLYHSGDTYASSFCGYGCRDFLPWQSFVSRLDIAQVCIARRNV